MLKTTHGEPIQDRFLQFRVLEGHPYQNKTTFFPHMEISVKLELARSYITGCTKEKEKMYESQGAQK